MFDWGGGRRGRRRVCDGRVGWLVDDQDWYDERADAAHGSTRLKCLAVSQASGGIGSEMWFKSPKATTLLKVTF